MTLIFVEPQAVYDRHTGISQSAPQRASVVPSTPSPATRLEPWRLPCDDVWTGAIFDDLSAYGEPMRITSVVNLASRLGRYANRAQRDNRRVALFRLVGELIKERRLVRVNRNFVTLPSLLKR